MQPRRAGRLLFSALAAACLLTPSAGWAQTRSQAVIVEETPLDVMVRRIASELRCVVCQGLSLQDSPSELAQEMRGVIREKLEEGLTPGEVKQYFVGRYGEFILLEPEPQGFNLAVYVLPVLALVGGGAVILIAMKRWTSRPPAEAAPVESADDADPELARWE